MTRTPRSRQICDTRRRYPAEGHEGAASGPVDRLDQDCGDVLRTPAVDGPCHLLSTRGAAPVPFVGRGRALAGRARERPGPGRSGPRDGLRIWLPATTRVNMLLPW